MKTISLSLLTIAIFGITLNANAQFGSGGRGVGTGSTMGLGSMGLGNTGMGGMGMNSMGMGSMGMGSMGSMGMGNMGRSGMGMGGMSGMNGMSSMGGMNGMSNSQSGGFIGANNNNSFIGATQNGNQGMGNRMMGGMSQMGMGNRMMGGMGQYGMGNRMGGYGNQNNQKRQLITAAIPAFEVPQKTSATLNSTLNQRLQATSGVRRLSGVQATLQGRTLVLKGAVATDHDKVLAEKLMLLEPGVDQVQNDLVVGSPSSAETKNSAN